MSTTQHTRLRLLALALAASLAAAVAPQAVAAKGDGLRWVLEQEAERQALEKKGFPQYSR